MLRGGVTAPLIFKLGGGGVRMWHVARMGEERGCIGSCWGNRREGDH